MALLVDKGKEMAKGFYDDVMKVLGAGANDRSLLIVPLLSMSLVLTPIGPDAQPLTAEARVISEALAGSGSMRKYVLTADQALSAGIQFLGEAVAK